MRGNLTKFFKDYYEHWGELNSVIDLMGDSGRMVSALSEYAVDSEEEQKNEVLKVLGRLYLSMNVLVEALGRDKVMSVTMALAGQLKKELERDKTEKAEEPEWDALDKLKEIVEEDSE